MDDPRARESRFNRASSGQWEGFEGHRREVSALLARGSGRLGVLGAGNANDLDLVGLLDAYREVHLVDLDPEALARGVERQGVAGRPGLARHGQLDLTGMMDAMAGWSPSVEVSRAELDALVDWPCNRVGLALPGPFDVVASTCLLSPLVGNAHHALGEGHPQLDEVALAIRLGHLRLLAGLARPGGRVVLITDVATSERCPEIAAQVGPPGLAQVADLAASHRLIRGVNPFTIAGLMRRDPSLSTRLARVELHAPWHWRLHRRAYLVCAIEATASSVAGFRA